MVDGVCDFVQTVLGDFCPAGIYFEFEVVYKYVCMYVRLYVCTYIRRKGLSFANIVRFMENSPVL